MDSVVRQRLVGTLVLVALGVVFWPIIFVEPRDQQPIELSPMPARPEIDTSPIASPESPEAKVRAHCRARIDELEQARADELTRLLEDLGEVGLADPQGRHRAGQRGAAAAAGIGRLRLRLDGCCRWRR